MTHDELISYIDDSTNGLKHEHLFEKLLANTKALRAVVELHKPKETKSDLQVCNYCRDIDDWKEVSFVWYPCPTIQAIERELG
jgi:hypothetical protein